MENIPVLLVEDNPLDARFIIKGFESSAVQNSITTLHDGEEALMYMKKLGIYEKAPTPGLMLLDLKMPRKNGLELLEDLKKLGLLKATKVVVITTSDSEEDIKKCSEFGVENFIIKPFDLEGFSESIKSIEPILEKIRNGVKGL